MELSFYVGISAGVLCTISFVPQVVKMYRSRNARDVSLLTFCIFSLGVTLWLLYGIMIREWPVIFANAGTLSLALTILIMKIRYR